MNIQTVIDTYLSVLRRYRDFESRAARPEFWSFTLVFWVITFIALMIDRMLGLYSSAIGLGVLSGIITLLHLVAFVAVSVRRLHDRNMVGWWMLLAFVPFIGSIILLVIYCLDGTRGANRFGPDPKGRAPLPTAP